MVTPVWQNRRAVPTSDPGSLIQQLRIAQSVSRGLKNKEIAVAQGTTEHVIKDYMRGLYNILGFSNRVEIARWCMKNHKEQAAP